MSHTFTVVVYEYKELSESAQEKALSQLREFEHDTFSPTDLSDQMKETLQEVFGIAGVEVWWNLNHCQGDGTAFAGHLDMDVFRKHYEEEYKKVWKALDKADATLNIQIKHEGRYYHWNSMNVEWEVDVELFGKTDRMVYSLIEDFRETIKSASKQLEEEGYNELEYRYSEDTMTEVAEMNGWLFHENGKLSEYNKFNKETTKEDIALELNKARRSIIRKGSKSEILST